MELPVVVRIFFSFGPQYSHKPKRVEGFQSWFRIGHTESRSSSLFEIGHKAFGMYHGAWPVAWSMMWHVYAAPTCSSIASNSQFCGAGQIYDSSKAQEQCIQGLACDYASYRQQNIGICCKAGLIPRSLPRQCLPGLSFFGPRSHTPQAALPFTLTTSRSPPGP